MEESEEIATMTLDDSFKKGRRGMQAIGRNIYYTNSTERIKYFSNKIQTVRISILDSTHSHL